MEQFALDTKNDMISGVCSGLANYFNVDITLVRVGFMFGTFLTGFTILLYIILAIAAPNDYELK